MFLDNRTTTDKIKALIKECSHIKIAVAYWGEGSIENLGLEKTSKRIKILCSLRSGATNPSVIEKLNSNSMDHIDIKHIDGLHSKCYIGNSRLIIGSSNASSNGLNLTDTELSNGNEDNWWEANYLVTNPDHIKDARMWFNELWNSANTVEVRDLDVAKKQWESRRFNRRGIARTSQVSWRKWNLIRLKSERHHFTDRKIFVFTWEDSYKSYPAVDKKQEKNLTSQGVSSESIWEQYGRLDEVQEKEFYFEGEYYVALNVPKDYDILDIDIVRFVPSQQIEHQGEYFLVYERGIDIPIPGFPSLSLTEPVQNMIKKKAKEINDRINNSEKERIELSELIDLL